MPPTILSLSEHPLVKGAAHKPLLPSKKELSGKAEKPPGMGPNKSFPARCKSARVVTANRPAGMEEERALLARQRLRRLCNCEKDRGIGPVRLLSER